MRMLRKAFAEVDRAAAVVQVRLTAAGIGLGVLPVDPGAFGAVVPDLEPAEGSVDGAVDVQDGGG
jgi:hypothetical protein